MKVLEDAKARTSKRKNFTGKTKLEVIILVLTLVKNIPSVYSLREDVPRHIYLVYSQIDKPEARGLPSRALFGLLRSQRLAWFKVGPSA